MSTQIRELIQKLRALQEVDLEIYKLRKEENRWPTILTSRNKTVDEKRRKLDLQEERMASLRTATKNKELTLKSLEDEVVKLNVQLNSVKTNKEYTALLNEIAHKKAEMSKIEEEILSSMESADEIKRDVAEAKAILEGVEEERRKIDEQAQDEIAEVQQEIEDLVAEREGKLKDVPVDILERYNRIINGRDGLAVVAVIDGVCQGCYMNLTPQEINVLMGEDEIITCRNCSRMLYLER